MSLRGQDVERGYAMAALLVALAVMAIMMSVALPVWRQEARRQKEDELIWRGQQYVRGIRLYAAKNGGILPPSVDALVSGHFIRKKYKDPITNDEFDYLGAGQTTPGGAPGQQPGRGGQPQAPGFSQPTQTSSTLSSGGAVPGGMSGVRSKSKDESIKVYLGRTHYNEWTFIYVSQQPGIGAPGRGQPGQIGPNGQPIGPGRGVGPNGQPLPFPPGGPGRGNPQGPGRGTFPPGFPPNPGRGRQ